MNQPETKAGEEIVRQFQLYLKECIGQHGFFPLPMMVLSGDGKLDPVELNMSDRGAMNTFCRAASHENTKATIVGIDRKISEDQAHRQRLETTDFLTVCLYERASVAIVQSIRVRDMFKFGVVEYNFQPRLIRPVRWDNLYWIDSMKSQLNMYIPDVILGSAGDQPWSYIQ